MKIFAESNVMGHYGSGRGRFMRVGNYLHASAVFMLLDNYAQRARYFEDSEVRFTDNTVSFTYVTAKLVFSAVCV
jgi:hypothetical protein